MSCIFCAAIYRTDHSLLIYANSFYLHSMQLSLDIFNTFMQVILSIHKSTTAQKFRINQDNHNIQIITNLK